MHGSDVYEPFYLNFEILVHGIRPKGVAKYSHTVKMHYIVENLLYSDTCL